MRSAFSLRSPYDNLLTPSYPAMIPFLPLQAINASFEPQLSQAVQRVVQSGWYLLGEACKAFEDEYARWLGASHCVGVGSGLDALTLALRHGRFVPLAGPC